jgi:hypothetical protein
MKRQLIVVGLAAFALFVLASLSATVAAPENAPSLQTTETEPDNNDFDGADWISVPGYATGVISETDTLDYFEIDTVSGREYQASFSVLENTGKLNLRMRVYNGDRGLVETSSSSQSYASISWTAYQTLHYVRIEALPAVTTTVQSAQYRLDIDEFAVPPPTDTPTPTSTPTRTPTPIPNEDDYEPNDSFSEAHDLPVSTSVTLSDLNFYSSGGEEDMDWFKFWAKDGKWYEARTSDLSGADTKIAIRDRNNGSVASDDDGGEGYASQVTWEARYDGYYYIRLTSKAGQGGYDLTVEEVGASATDTPGPTPSSPDADRCDRTELGNHDFDHACVIAADKSEEFNFCPPPYGGPDNDFFKIWVKPGLHFECATSDLSPGVDPNMIVYDHNREPIGGNDDVEPGDYNSYFAYYATYEGWLYLLVGTGDRTPTDVYNSDYTLRCAANVPGQTSTPESTGTPTPTSRTATPTSPPPSPTPAEKLSVRPLTTPTPVPARTPAPRFIPITLLVYYDGNDDGQPGAGEGIGGISAQAYEVATNQLLAQGFADEQGHLEFTVAAQGPVRVSVPFFGFSQLVAGEGASIYLRIPPQPLVGGTP